MVIETPPTILHVDDNEESRHAVTSYLRNAGFLVREAATGREALRELATRPDLLLIDVNLPDISGTDVCREVKNNPQTALIPVLQISGTYITSDDRARSLDQGADGYLIKPVQPDELVAHVRALLRLRRAEEAAATLARQWQAMFDALSDGVCLLDRSGLVLHCNRALANLFGRPSAEVIGSPYRDLVRVTFKLANGIPVAPPSLPPGLGGEEGGASRARKIEERALGGRWFRITTDPVFDDRGAVVGTAHVWSDITERLQAEEERRKAQQRFRDIFEASKDAIGYAGLDGKMLDVNGAFVRLTGYSREELVGGTKYRYITPPEYEGPEDRQVRQLLLTGEPVEYEKEYVRKDGTRVPIHLTVSLVRGPDGRPTGTAAIIRDLTERKQREAELRERHALLTAITEGTTDAVFVKDLQGRYLLINSAGAGFLGRTADEVLGKADVEVFAPESGRRIMEQDAKVVASGRVQTYEETVTAQGITRVFMSNKGPYRDPHGNVAGLVGISRDITERKRAEAERLRLAAFTAEVGAALGGSDDLQEMLQRCAEAMVRHLGAAFARIWMIDADGDVLFLRASAGLYTHRDGPHGRVAVGQLKIGRIAQERRPHLTNDVANDPQIGDPGWAREQGMVAFAGHPLVVAGELVGVLGMFAREPVTEFTAKALAAAADHIALGIKRRQAEETVRAFHEEFRVARKIQQHLFPRVCPSLPGFDLHGASVSAEATGGDYYDFIDMPDGSLGVVVGDVSGHGFGPALLMSEARAYLRAFARTRADVGEILALANRVLVKDTGEDRFITTVFARLDPRTGSFSYASAGHLTGYILDASGAVKSALASTGCPLGVFPEAEFATGPPAILEPGDIVLLLTDGIVEVRAPDDTAFGARRALDIVRCYRHGPAAAIVDNLYHAVRAFTQNRPLQDDVTAVVIKVEPAAGRQSPG